MAPITALIYLLPLLATLADATPINRRIGRRNANKVCHKKTSGATTTDKPQWADYAAHSGGDDKYAKHPPVAVGNGQRYPDIDGGKYPDEDDEVDDDVVSSTSESAPTPTSAQQQAPTSSPPTPSPSPTEAEPEPALEPSSEPPTPAPSDDSQSTTYPVGSVIPVPHPNLTPQPNYPTNNDPQGWMEAHNMIRAQFGVGTVGWSEGAYAQAKANVEGHAANGCKMEHTKDGCVDSLLAL